MCDGQPSTARRRRQSTPNLSGAARRLPRRRLLQRGVPRAVGINCPAPTDGPDTARRDRVRATWPRRRSAAPARRPTRPSFTPPHPPPPAVVTTWMTQIAMGCWDCGLRVREPRLPGGRRLGRRRRRAPPSQGRRTTTDPGQCRAFEDAVRGRLGHQEVLPMLSSGDTPVAPRSSDPASRCRPTCATACGSTPPCPGARCAMPEDPVQPGRGQLPPVVACRGRVAIPRWRIRLPPHRRRSRRTFTPQLVRTANTMMTTSGRGRRGETVYAARFPSTTSPTMRAALLAADEVAHGSTGRLGERDGAPALPCAASSTPCPPARADTDIHVRCEGRYAGHLQVGDSTPPR